MVERIQVKDLIEQMREELRLEKVSFKKPGVKPTGKPKVPSSPIPKKPKLPKKTLKIQAKMKKKIYKKVLTKLFGSKNVVVKK